MNVARVVFACFVVRGVGRLALVLAAVVAVSGCASIPVDPDGTLERVSGGVLRAGMSGNEPWTSHDGERTGVEVDLVEDFAAA